MLKEIGIQRFLLGEGNPPGAGKLTRGEPDASAPEQGLAPPSKWNLFNVSSQL